MKLPEKLTRLKAYDPITGNFPVRLDANESFFDLSPALKAKLAESLKQLPYNRYPDPFATEVVEAFSAYYRVSPNCVTAGNGSDEIITLLLNCFLERGDRLVTVAPDFSMYRVYASLAELEVVTVPKAENLQIDLEALIAACKEARAVVFSNPCNPTSLGLQKNEVLQLVEAVPDCMVIVDEAYMDFWNETVLPFVEKYDNLIVLRTCSKAIGLASARMGFAVMEPVKTGLLRAAKSPYNCNGLSQTLCAMVLRQTAMLERCREEIIVQAHRLHSAISTLSQQYPILETTPATRTNFVFMKIPCAEEIHAELLKKGIAVRYMPPNGLRVCAGTRREQMLFLSEFEQILQAH